LNTFKHSGDLGDIVFSLPAVRALGGGVLYLDPEGGKDEPLVHFGYTDRTRLDRAGIDSLRTLLVQQPYVADVRLWTGQAVTYNLDLFRRHLTFNNLSDSHLAAFKLDAREKDARWLQVSETDPRLAGRVAISRSLKVHGNHTFWEFEVRKIRERCVFLGTRREHEFFEEALGYTVDYAHTPTIADLAVAIASAESFIGNQSLAHAIAEGLKKDLIQEVYRVGPAAVFRRQGARYV